MGGREGPRYTQAGGRPPSDLTAEPSLCRKSGIGIRQGRTESQGERGCQARMKCRALHTQPSFRGARSASPESITTTGSMDSGPAPRGASRNDGRYDFTTSRHDAPELCRNVRPKIQCAARPSIEGAGNAGCRWHPQPVCIGRKHTVVTTVAPEHPAFPHAMVLTAYSALFPATNSSCHRRQRIKVFRTRSGS
jgi:hypothetical protein